MNQKRGIVAEMAEGVMQNIKASILLLRETPRTRKLLVDVSCLKEEIEFVLAKLHEMGYQGETLGTIRGNLYDTNDLVDQICDAAKSMQKHQQHLTCWSCCSSRKYLSFDAKEVNAMTKRFRDVKVDTQVSVRGTPCEYAAAKEPQMPIGRSNDIHNIAKLLQVPDSGSASASSSGDKILVISIYGMEGLGKTTLARFVFDDNDVRKQFKIHVWISVGNDFSLYSLLLKIVTELIGENPSLELEQLRIRLEDKISKVIFLLVLDNVLAFDLEIWHSLLDLLSGGASHSKIVITTTRSEELAKQLDYTKCTVEPYKLEALTDDDAWSLFEQVAFQPGEANKDAERRKFGKTIVRKCDNVPHTIQVVGSDLLHKSKLEWEVTSLRSKESYLQTPSNLTEEQLPTPLKQCFAYCAIFPTDDVINKRNLIHHWIAHDFIRQPSDDNGKTLEDVGEENFMKLQKWSFFIKLKPDEQGNVHNFNMQPFALNQARSMAESEIMVIQDSTTTNIPMGIYHLLFDGSSKLPLKDLIISLPAQLRSFLMVKGSTKDLTKSDYAQLFSHLKYLRVLDLHASNMGVVPNSIGLLKHLRYLNLSRNDFRSLPDSITKLMKLQVLDLSHCQNLRELPKHITRLESLRHLYLEGCDKLISMPVGIGRMTSLRTLSHFVLGEGQNSCKLDELSSLKLREELTIVFACKQKL